MGIILLVLLLALVLGGETEAAPNVHPVGVPLVAVYRLARRSTEADVGDRPPGASPPGRGPPAIPQMLNPAIRVVHATMGGTGPNISVCRLVSGANRIGCG